MTLVGNSFAALVASLQLKMTRFCDVLVVFAALATSAICLELTFELPDNDKQCFHEVVDKGVKCTIEFQVSICLKSG